MMSNAASTIRWHVLLIIRGNDKDDTINIRRKMSLDASQHHVDAHHIT
jgi:hypothetical protein